MTTWIVTTGNSDVQLETQAHWLELYAQVSADLQYLTFNPSPSHNSYNSQKPTWTLPARVLGIAYGNNIENFYDDLCFPLLDNFSTKLLESSPTIPDRIFYILTDQSALFPDYIYSENSPVWKDTCTLSPFFERYFQNKFPKAKVFPITLTPQTEYGLDHWDSILTLVNQAIGKIPVNKSEITYVSHQAGTPAMSSALQFATLSKFGKKVKFLIGNEYQNSLTEIIDSSRYLRGLKIEQAKGLISVSPGGAKKILEDVDNLDSSLIKKLDDFVNFFNLNRASSVPKDEFLIEAATQRIVDALDLIGIFLTQDNYLQAITLISAAQETFLKVAILSKTQNLTVSLNNQVYTGSQLLFWEQKGLCLTDTIKAISRLTLDNKKQILQKLLCPFEPEKINYEDDLKKVNRNYVMLKWLQKLEPKFKSWPLLNCYKRNRENDLRNQLMHNLRGVEKDDVIKYLNGFEESELTKIMDIYNQKIKQPFFDAILLINLPYTREKLSKELQNLASSLS
jgi:hypothetical protein